METLQDKVVLLTGGSRGLGPNIAQALVIKGARIVLVARSRSTLQEVTTQLGGHAGNAQFMTVDLRQPSEREELVTQLLMKFGKIDILINNAGLETEGAFIEQPWCAIEETIEVNLLAPMALTRLVLPGMLERKTGHIVNIASVTAKTGAPYAAVYSGSKAGLIGDWLMRLSGTVDFQHRKVGK